MSETIRQRNVVIALNIGGKAGREYLQGIFRYLNEGHPWNLRLLHHSDELTVPVIRRELADGADAFLVGFAKQGEPLDFLLHQPRPVVFVDYPGMHVGTRRKDVVFVRSDDEALGLIAAHYLHHCGNFRSYGFLPDADAPRWSVLRERGFRTFLAKKGITPSVHVPSGQASGGLEAWGLSLEKPAAVFAVSDNHAVDFVAACRRIGVAIPDQLILVGTDNDELLCNSSSPALSSFVPDHEGIGYRAARELDLMLAGKEPRQREIAIAPNLSPVERASTQRGSVAGFLIRRALDFINANAARAITVSDVIAHVGVSRRLVYLRFRQQLHKSIHQVLVDARLDLARKHLRNGKLTLREVATLAGFPSAAALTAAFKARYGKTPRSRRNPPKPARA